MAMSFRARIAGVSFAFGVAASLLLFGAGTAPAYACDPHTGENCDLIPEEGFVISDGPTHPGEITIIAEDPNSPPLDAGHHGVQPTTPLPPECTDLDIANMALWVMTGCGPFLP
jgi:hypothetical protein